MVQPQSLPMNNIKKTHHSVDFDKQTHKQKCSVNEDENKC